jgi:hypothetical protein
MSLGYPPPPPYIETIVTESGQEMWRVTYNGEAHDYSQRWQAHVMLHAAAERWERELGLSDDCPPAA